MPRRKADTDDVASTAKKIKSSALISGFTVQWEFESSNNKWTAYPASQNEEIIEAFNGSKEQVEIVDAKNQDFTINLGKMVHKVKKTGWEKRLRCCVQGPKSEDFYAWQRQEGKKRTWFPFSVTNVLALEKHLTEKKNTVDLDVDGTSYTLDLESMEYENDAGATCKVARIKSEANQAPEPPVASTVGSKTKSGKKVEENGVVGKPAAKSASKKVKSENKTDDKPSKSSTSKTLLLKGKAPVDPECVQKVGKAHVYYEGQNVYDCMLNQTNLQNNNNKYYLCQLLEDDGKRQYSVWFRWGRVGKTGQNTLVPCGPDLEEAKNVFCKKFYDKTRNDWHDRNKFEKVAGKYDLLKMDYSTDQGVDEVDAGKKTKKDVKVPESKLDKRVQALVELICDVRSMEQAVLEMKYDSKKAPLGKLTKDQIKAGYAALKKIDECISKGEFGRHLLEACNEFYTRIPHDFGMKTPPMIRTKEEVKIKLSLLEALGDIEIAIRMLKEGDSSDNPVDRHYKSLHCDLKALEKKDADYKLVEDYLKNTHAPTHSQYNMQVLDIFACEKEGEKEKFKDHGNRMLLWHGSRLTNWAGIINQGLRIAPPEAPVTGYMFGKGVYFADMSSKSANYCFATKSRNVGLLLLCEVSLGDQNELLAADYKADKLPAGKNSVKGLGRLAPDPVKTFTMSDGTLVPLGKPKDTGVSNPNGYTLNYNEYIVYDTKQIKSRYLCKVKFNFK